VNNASNNDPDVLTIMYNAQRKPQKRVCNGLESTTIGHRRSPTAVNHDPRGTLSSIIHHQTYKSVWWVLNVRKQIDREVVRTGNYECVIYLLTQNRSCLAVPNHPEHNPLAADTMFLQHIDAIAVEDVPLGRLVLNTLEPHQDFFDPPGIPDASIKCEVQSLQNFRNNLTTTSLQSRFSKFLSIASSNKNDGVKEVSAGKVEIQKLNNSGKWFRESCRDAGVRQWLEDALDLGANIYLIIGYCVLTTTHYDSKLGEGVAVSASVYVPISITDAGNTLSVSADGAHERRFEERTVAVFPGPIVCAVQYRKLKFKWLSSRELGNGFLELGHRWKQKSAFRGEANSDEDDVLEVDLAGDSDEDEGTD